MAQCDEMGARRNAIQNLSGDCGLGQTAFTGASLHHPCQDLERTQEVKVQVPIDACGGLSARTEYAALRRIEAASLLRLPCGRRRGPPAD